MLTVIGLQFPTSGIVASEEMTMAWMHVLGDHHTKAVFEAYEHFLGKGDAFPPTVGQIAARAKFDAPGVIEIGFDRLRPGKDSHASKTQHYSISEHVDGKEIKRVYICKRSNSKAGDRVTESRTGLVRTYLD